MPPSQPGGLDRHDPRRARHPRRGRRDRGAGGRACPRSSADAPVRGMADRCCRRSASRSAAAAVAAHYGADRRGLLDGWLVDAVGRRRGRQVEARRHPRAGRCRCSCTTSPPRRAMAGDALALAGRSPRMTVRTRRSWRSPGLPEIGAGDDLAGLIVAHGRRPRRRRRRHGDQQDREQGRGRGRPGRPGGRYRCGDRGCRCPARRDGIARTRQGLVLAAAGVDASNTRPARSLLLPDRARRVRPSAAGRPGGARRRATSAS